MAIWTAKLDGEPSPTDCASRFWAYDDGLTQALQQSRLSSAPLPPTPLAALPTYNRLDLHRLNVVCRVCGSLEEEPEPETAAPLEISDEELAKQQEAAREAARQLSKKVVGWMRP